MEALRGAAREGRDPDRKLLETEASVGVGRVLSVGWIDHEDENLVIYASFINTDYCLFALERSQYIFRKVNYCAVHPIDLRCIKDPEADM